MPLKLMTVSLNSCCSSSERRLEMKNMFVVNSWLSVLVRKWVIFFFAWDLTHLLSYIYMRGSMHSQSNHNIKASIMKNHEVQILGSSSKQLFFMNILIPDGRETNVCRSTYKRISSTCNQHMQCSIGTLGFHNSCSIIAVLLYRDSKHYFIRSCILLLKMTDDRFWTNSKQISN